MPLVLDVIQLIGFKLRESKLFTHMHVCMFIIIFVMDHILCLHMAKCTSICRSFCTVHVCMYSMYMIACVCVCVCALPVGSIDVCMSM